VLTVLNSLRWMSIGLIPIAISSFKKISPPSQGNLLRFIPKV